VVTSRVRAFVPDEDPESERIGVDLVDAERQRTGATALIPWVRREELALLGPSVLFGAGNSFLRRLQIHISIGQAF
jgi:hypothetical protein